MNLSINEWINERMYEWMNEWMNQSINQSINQSLNAWKNELCDFISPDLWRCVTCFYNHAFWIAVLFTMLPFSYLKQHFSLFQADNSLSGIFLKSVNHILKRDHGDLSITNDWEQNSRAKTISKFYLKFSPLSKFLIEKLEILLVHVIVWQILRCLGWYKTHS